VLTVTIPRDEGEVQVHVVGKGWEEPLPALFLDVGKLKGSPVALRLLDCVYAVESGLKVFLWWEGTEHALLLPLEGRGRLDLTPIGGIHNPRHDGFTGHVLLTTQGEGFFFLGLEFAKVRI
jgi:hypothetical protein